ncbi:MAG: hypothetical protein ACI8Y4_000376 [Candidatus Poriferisodalaceae bacterium]
MEHDDASYDDAVPTEPVPTEPETLPATSHLTLDAFEARVLGALIEKALTTPQNYPLSINALITACNQTTNRDPLTTHTESDVAELLPLLKERRLMRFVHPTSGRGVTKYKHVLDENLGLDHDELGLMSVLLVRGPQTVGELRTRTERMSTYTDVGEIEDCLNALTDLDGNRLVSRLEREPGHREPRWIQLLCAEQGIDRAGQPAVSPRAAAMSPGLADDVAALRSELDALREEFNAFKAEFG